MKDHIFIETEARQGEVFGFEPSLFHDPRHLDLQSPTGWHWYYLKSVKTNEVVVSLYLNHIETKAYSALRSPFGTIECAETTSPETLFGFIELVESKLKDKGITHVEIKCSPLAYAPRNNAMIVTFLSNHHYQVKMTEITACIPVQQQFLEGVRNEKSTVLQKSKTAGLTFRLLNLDALKDLYQFIVNTRREKRYVLSMEYSDLAQTVSRFPKNFVLSGVFDESKLVGASIAVIVHSTILYNFYVDHDAAYDKVSPVLLIQEGLYEYCLEHQIRLLDLGTSSLGGTPNFGLLSFKMRIGGEPSIKVTFEKAL